MLPCNVKMNVVFLTMIHGFSTNPSRATNSHPFLIGFLLTFLSLELLKMSVSYAIFRMLCNAVLTNWFTEKAFLFFDECYMSAVTLILIDYYINLSDEMDHRFCIFFCLLIISFPLFSYILDKCKYYWSIFIQPRWRHW